MSDRSEKLNQWNIEAKCALECIVNCYVSENKASQDRLPYYIGRAAKLLELRERYCWNDFDMEKII